MKEDSNKNNKLSYIFYNVLIPILVIVVINLSIKLNNSNDKNMLISDRNDSSVQNLPSYITKTGKGINGVEFSFDLDGFVEKYNSYIYEYCNGNEAFITMFKLEKSDFADITKETLQYQKDNPYGLIKRYTGRSTHYGTLANSSSSDAFIIDYYSDNNIGQISFMTYSYDINNGQTLSNLLQAIFNMPKETAETTITNIKEHNKTGETVGYDDKYCIKWETTKSGKVTYFNIIPFINE